MEQPSESQLKPGGHLGGLPAATAAALVERGKRLYDERLRDQLEPQHTGRYVAIDPDSRRCFLADTSTQALVEAHRALPESLFYIARVGHAVAGKMSGYGRRNR